MHILPNITRVERKDIVHEADITEFITGIILLAAGALAASFVTLNIVFAVKGVLLLIGAILGICGFFKMAKYLRQRKAFKAYVPTWDASRGIYERFAKELNEYRENGKMPENGDADIAYFLKLQEERLKQRNLTLKDDVEPAKGEGFGTATLQKKSSWYTVDMSYSNIVRRLEFRKNGEKIYGRRVEQIMYETIVHSPDERKSEQMMITCPNCGNVSHVSQLTEGCRYCGTRFRISDLFPRVTNVYFCRANSIHTNQKMFTETMVSVMAVLGIVTFISECITGKYALPLILLASYAMAVFVGGFIGLIIGDIRLLAGLADRDGMKHISLFKALSAKRKLLNTMTRFDKNFSYDKFEGQLVALIRMAVFAEDTATLTACRNFVRDKEFEDIVEMTYTKGMCLQNVVQKGNMLYLLLRTWWINYSEKDGKVIKTGDCIDTVLSRNVSRQEPPGFSITSVNCHSCGGSFDAVRQRNCPYCGSEYHMEDEGWVIEDMKLVR